MANLRQLKVKRENFRDGAEWTRQLVVPLDVAVKALVVLKKSTVINVELLDKVCYI